LFIQILSVLARMPHQMHIRRGSFLVTDKTCFYHWTPMYASQLWCNFRKSCMQRLRMAYNFGCRALYNLPWRQCQM